MGMAMIGEGGFHVLDSINGVHIPRRRRSCWVGSMFKDESAADHDDSISMLEAATILMAMANGGFCKDVIMEEEEKKKNRKRKKSVPSPPASKKQRKKRRKVMELLESSPPEEMPAAMRDRIVEMGGYEIQLVIQKQLQDTDLNKNHGRLLLPTKKVRIEFTTEEEERKLSNDNDNDKNKKGIEVMMIMDDDDEDETSIWLKKWKIGSGQSYCLMTNWNSFVEKTHLRTGDCIQLWSFRSNSISSHRLCFAIVKLHISQSL